MSTYYLKSTGSPANSATDFSTEETAADSMWDIRNLSTFESTDTIKLCDDVTETTFDGGAVYDICNIEAQSGLDARPIYYYNTISSGPIYSGTSASIPIDINGIHIKYNNSGSPAFNSTNDNGAPISATNCIFDLENRTGLGNGYYYDCLIAHSFSGTASGPIIGGYTGMDVGLDHCTIIDSTSAGDTGPIVTIVDAPDNITNNIFVFNDKNNTGIIACSGTGLDTNISNNLWFGTTLSGSDGYVYDYSDTPTILSGANATSINADPLFTTEGLTYTLSFNSPAMYAGNDRKHMGWDTTTLGPKIKRKIVSSIETVTPFTPSTRAEE